MRLFYWFTYTVLVWQIAREEANNTISHVVFLDICIWKRNIWQQKIQFRNATMLHSIRAAVLLFCQLWQETSLTWPQHQHLGYKKENANVLHLDTISTSMEGTEGKDCISRNVDVIKHVCLMPASPILYYFETNKIGHTWLALHYWCRKDICTDLKCTCRLRNFPLGYHDWYHALNLLARKSSISTVIISQQVPRNLVLDLNYSSVIKLAKQFWNHCYEQVPAFRVTVP